MVTKKNPPEGEASDEARDLAEQATESILGPNPFIGLQPQDVFASYQALGRQVTENPQLLVEQEGALIRDLIAVLAGTSDLAPVKGDKRFSDESWQDNPFYRMIMQGHFAWANSLQGLVDRSALDERSKDRARFAVSLLTDAWAPTNTLLGNPAVMRKTWETKGWNLVDGMKNLIGDMQKNGGLPSQVDKSAFEVGGNLAKSEGAVVFRNPVLELIQYTPTTAKVHETPHLIVPPEVNKFYVFDLSPGKSMIEYLTNSGIQVFAVSWRNPTAEHADWNMDTYVAAVLEAMDALRDITGSPEVVIHAACSGAMTAAGLAGHLAAKGDDRIAAMTMMVAVLGQTTEGTLSLFSTEETAAAAKLRSQAAGVLDGVEMNRVFAWLRPNDLVWNYWVNNYLMGNAPPVFDILYWSNDSTRLPAAFHAEVLDMFLDNRLVKPGEMTVLGTPIDLSRVECDTMFIAGVTDHITPWKGVYSSAISFGGEKEFILSNSGHIQSLINPPTNKRAKYFTNPDMVASADAWLKQAQPVEGSWWDRWRVWASERSGELVPAPKTLGSRRHKPLDKAPGTYVHEA
ncbi:PHA/PHB synthase family protein [Paracoccus marinaquae]|uniref:Alpha/beta fold hydrolase n=1 Tax=Paracoccus marinaquae TaxID=2841926 RepID=A0ABS6AM82_9RHOB|nr:alpha/beta fold hydrolase [Paracoccus marinaquae]MBU3030982.1 alpha/beta fold hydrolase [Paracoccus marinaquae]